MMALASLWCATPAAAAEQSTIEVVIDPASGLPRFKPEILFIQPGDEVRFKSSGRTYASRGIPGMLPEGMEPWWGQIGTDIVVTFAEPGLYGHKCGASYRLGLVGLIIVGDDPPANLTTARAVPHPAAAAAEFDKLFDKLDQHYRVESANRENALSRPH